MRAQGDRGAWRSTWAGSTHRDGNGRRKIQDSLATIRDRDMDTDKCAAAWSPIVLVGMWLMACPSKMDVRATIRFPQCAGSPVPRGVLDEPTRDVRVGHRLHGSN